MHCAFDGIAFCYAKHPIGHHNPCSCLHHIVRYFTSIQLGGILPVHPLVPALIILDLAQVGVQELHAIGQLDLALPEHNAFIPELPPLRKCRVNKAAAHVPKGYHRMRRAAVDVDDFLGSYAVDEQFFGGAGV